MKKELSEQEKGLDKSNNLNQQKESTKEIKINLYDKTSDFIGIYYHKYNELSDDDPYNPNMILKIYFLIDMIIVCGHKMKKNGLIKKNLRLYQRYRL